MIANDARFSYILQLQFAEVAELADALDSKSSPVYPG
jgi:hypothetical protein